jgi:phosphatidylserine synthase 2
MTWENFYDNFDHYYLVHLVNWFLASFVIRDAWILHMWSILDEALELSWQHILPHFRECWWDHICHDIILSNTPAIFFGLWIIDKLGWKRTDWLGRANAKSFWDWEIFTWYI